MKCKYCDADVSVAEKICPSCHHPVNELNPEAIAKKKRNRWLKIGIGLIAVIFIATTVGMTLLSQQERSAETSQSTSTASGPSLGLRYDKLMDRFNDNANVKKEKILMQGIDAKNNTFSYNLAKTILISGQLDPKSHQLLSLEMIARPASREESVQMVTTMGVLIESFFPSDANNMRQKVLSDLGFRQGGNIQEANNTSVQENIKFHFAAVKDTGYVFTITHKDAE